MPSVVLVRRGVAMTVLVGVGLILVRRAGLAHHYPPLAAFGAPPPLLLHPTLLLMKASMTRCRTLLTAMFLISGPALPGLALAAPVAGMARPEAQPAPAPADSALAEPGTGDRVRHRYLVTGLGAVLRPARPATLRI